MEEKREKTNGSKMNKETLDIIRKNLLDERDLLLSKTYVLGEVDSSGDEFDEIQGNLINAMNEALSKRDVMKLDAINKTLLKLENLEFGKCEECDDLIAEKRLIANPSVKLCLSCAEDAEAEQRLNKLR